MGARREINHLCWRTEETQKANVREILQEAKRSVILRAAQSKVLRMLRGKEQKKRKP